jgi:hypothetical protein
MEEGPVMDDFVPDSEFQPDQPVTQIAQQAGPDFIPEDKFLSDEDKFGSTDQILKTFGEGMGESLTFGLSTGAQRLAGVKGEDITGRREENPIAHAAGQVAGIAAGMFIGTGEAALLEKAGMAVGKKIVGESLKAKVGSGMAKLATENALFQAGDEVSKMFAGNPTQSVGTAMADIGLAGIIGAPFGAVPPLWKATVGGKVSELLTAIKNKAGGIEGELSQPVKEAIENAGVNLPAEIKAGLSDDPIVQNAFKTLQQSDTTKSGIALQESYGKVKTELADSMIQSLGKSQDSIPALKDLSDAKAGVDMGDILAKEVAEKFDPIIEKFDKVKTEFADAELLADTFADQMAPGGLGMERVPVGGTISTASERLGKLAMEQGWLAAREGADPALVRMAMKNLPKQKTLKDLSNLISAIGKRGEELSSPTNFGPSRTAQMINGVLKDAESDVIIARLGQKNPMLADEYRAVKAAYREASLLREELQSKIGVKSSLGRFADSIKDHASSNAEKLLARLTKTNDADLIRLLQEQFPATANAVKEYQLNSILATAAAKAKPGELINSNALIKAIDNLSPEMRAFAVPPGAVDRIRAVGTLLDQFSKAPHNFSNTARTADKLFEYVPASAVGMITMMAGGNPVLAGAAGILTKYLGKDVPDALRLSMLKFLGSPHAVDSAAFKAMNDVAGAVVKGEKAVNRATRAVLRPSGSKATHREVSENDRRKLDKQLLALQDDPSPLLNVAGDTAHYLPEYATAMGETAARAVNYLNSLRPDTQKALLLDAEPEADPVKKAAFERALTIAQNPLIVLEDVKDGTLVPEDLITLQNVAPGLYARMREKLTAELVDRTAEEEPIPYKTRLGLAMFLGTPLDSTMTPEAIQAAQPKPEAPPMPQGPVKPSATGMQKLSKLGPANATQGQARQMDRAKRLS